VFTLGEASILLTIAAICVYKLGRRRSHLPSQTPQGKSDHTHPPVKAIAIFNKAVGAGFTNSLSTLKSNLCKPAPLTITNTLLGAGLPKLSVGSKINWKTRPYKPFNENAARFQF
jgi:hypothetical protein